MLYVINFADKTYQQQQQLNTRSAYEQGKADMVFEFHEKDITTLKEEFPEHFKIKRGYGLWFWKPFLILKAMEKLNNNDYLFYCDSGAIFIDDIHKLIPDFEASKKDIMVFEQPLLSRCFTKKETYHLLGCNDFTGNQLLGGYILLKKSPQSIKYMKEWFYAMSDIKVLSAKKFFPSIIEDKDFRVHREDQSVLTILCKKWEIEAYRDPSDLGLFPWGYLRAGGYHRKKYHNSHYPPILLCVRKNDPITYKKNYDKALKLYKIGLNNEFTARVKLMPMYIRHWGRLFAQSIGMEEILNRFLSK